MDTTNTKAEPGAFDILAEAKAAPDEPKFTLWGRDPSAPALVNEWARLNRERVFAATDLAPEKVKAELIQSSDAEAISWAMLAYQRGQAASAEIQKERAGFVAGVGLGADELAAKERHDTLLGGARTLDNALSEATDIADAVRSLGEADAADLILAGCEKLREASAMIRPTRPSYAHLDLPSV